MARCTAMAFATSETLKNHRTFHGILCNGEFMGFNIEVANPSAAKWLVWMERFKALREHLDHLAEPWFLSPKKGGFWLNMAKLVQQLTLNIFPSNSAVRCHPALQDPTRLWDTIVNDKVSSHNQCNLPNSSKFRVWLVAQNRSAPSQQDDPCEVHAKEVPGAIWAIWNHAKPPNAVNFYC